MKRRTTLALGAAMALPGLPVAVRAAGKPDSPTTPPPKAGERVLRYAFPIAETGFDPAQINDTYSRTVTAHIFEALYGYDHLARPPKMVPLTAAGEPEHSDDFRSWIFKVRPGIFFADDPAFKGQDGQQVKRELVAQDFVFSIKRYADPVVKSPLTASVESWKIAGLWDVRKTALDTRKPFEYDKPIDGLRALDRYTLQFKLADPMPRFWESMATSDLFGAVAREVVELYGDKIAEHPVGTGPFKLARWRRSSLIVLERNPAYRQRVWDAQPAADDVEGQAMAAKLRGKPLPLLDRIEISIIDEQQPRWLSFLNGQHDFIDRLPAEFISVAMPGKKVAPNLAKQGIRGVITLASEIVLTYFNCDDAVVGGNEPAQVALRRAICLGVDLQREINTVRRGMAIAAQSPVMPHTSGYDPEFKSEASEYNPARAKALLELHGYVDRDGDGFRELPDGRPLLLELATQASQIDRQFNELWKKNMDAIGIRVVFKTQKWPENLKAARSGKLQMWGVASSASGGDGQGMLTRYFGPQAGNQNLSRFKHARFDELHERLSRLPDGPERLKLFDEAKRIAIAFAPYKLHCHRLVADMTIAALQGYRRPVYWNEWWMHVDVDPALRQGAAA
ncbi:MAG: ABC transporter substrate-binding protein [Rubrivivax sp.]|nr:ABC transporter substrate-binding protein [Rubrivivax sp.]